MSPDPARLSSTTRRRRRAILWMIAAAALVVAGAVAISVCVTPSWYRAEAAAAVDPQAVRDDLRDAAQGFSDALMQSGVFDVHLGETQLNRWIAMRAEIYPLIERRIPAGWRDPAVRFRDGVIRLAATHHGVGPDVVLSLDLTLEMDGGELVVRVVGCRAGVLRIPMALLGFALAAPIDIPPGRAWRGSPEMRGNLRDGLRIAPRGVWPNGDRLYNVVSVGVRRNWLDFKIESLGPARQSRRSEQSGASGNPFADSE